jgi:hypothetical protein
VDIEGQHYQGRDVIEQGSAEMFADEKGAKIALESFAIRTSIRLTIEPAGPFTWQVTQKGKSQSFGGSSTYDQGLLTLTQDKGPVLVGRVSWSDPNHMTFRIDGDGPEDSGLNFTK